MRRAFLLGLVAAPVALMRGAGAAETVHLFPGGAPPARSVRPARPSGSAQPRAVPNARPRAVTDQRNAPPAPASGFTAPGDVAGMRRN